MGKKNVKINSNRMSQGWSNMDFSSLHEAKDVTCSGLSLYLIEGAKFITLTNGEPTRVW